MGKKFNAIQLIKKTESLIDAQGLDGKVNASKKADGLIINENKVLWPESKRLEVVAVNTNKINGLRKYILNRLELGIEVKKAQ